MVKQDEILVTGGSGLLGKEIKKLLPNANYPTHEEFDVTQVDSMIKYFRKKEWFAINVILHCAALTSPPKINKSPLETMTINIMGTVNVVGCCQFNQAKLIYISTDYVFDGSNGNYKEDDSVLPINKYAWSKLGGECAVRMYDNSLIIRTSFGEDVFPYEKAFIDQWTSREKVSIIAKKIVKLIKSDLTGIINIGGYRKTVYEYAKESKPNVGKLRRNEVDFKVPKDTSLDCSKYKNWLRRKNE